MEEDNFPIRVTEFFKTREASESWKRYLENKGYKTCFAVSTNENKEIVYALYRNLSIKELKEIAAGDYVIVDESLKKANNGIIIKED